MVHIDSFVHTIGLFQPQILSPGKQSLATDLLPVLSGCPTTLKKPLLTLLRLLHREQNWVGKRRDSHMLERSPAKITLRPSAS
jgi:hypothetical protein